MSRVLITGVTGQDGFYLAAQCLTRGDEVYGLIRWDSKGGARKADLERDLPGIRLIDGDLTDQPSLKRALEISNPNIVFNLAALASSGQSWAQPMMMGEINAIGVLKLLEAIRWYDPDIRFVQASTSEQYGRVNELPQSEKTPFGSLNVYGIAKTFAHQTVINYRDSYGLHASTALMHNHVSYRRNHYFVDRKVTRAVARIKRGLDHELRLGNTEASRDWGWGPEYMEAWRMIAAYDVPGDYILATGESYSVQHLVESAFMCVNLNATDYVVTDPALFRPTDVAELRGDPSFIKKTLGWEASTRFEEIVELLVTRDLDEIDRV